MGSLMGVFNPRVGHRCLMEVFIEALFYCFFSFPSFADKTLDKLRVVRLPITFGSLPIELVNYSFYIGFLYNFNQ